MNNKIFENLFVLELANNHNGSLEKGRKIILEFSRLVFKYNIKAGIKLQFREYETFIHKNFKNDFSNPYIKKVTESKLDFESYRILINFIKEQGLLAISTPFDEVSADFCKNVDIVKIASADINDWPLLEAVSKLNKPIILSTGGADDAKIDKAVNFLKQKNIPLAINHCVSIYPTQKNELNLNRISYLKNRYSDYTIGFSTHEYNGNLELSMLGAYMLGARTFERHIDIDTNKLSYCSNPNDIEKIFKAYNCLKESLGNTDFSNNEKEQAYIKSRFRGYYAKNDLKSGQKITKEDVYLAIPALEGQLTFSDKIEGLTIKKDIKKDKPIKFDILEQ